MTPSLHGRTALITGASHGLGYAITRAFILAGARVVMCAREIESLMAAAEELRVLVSPGQCISWRTLDVTDPKAVDQCVSETITRFGRLHILVNNAGIYGPMGSLEDTDWDAWTRTIQTNLYGPALMMRAVLPHMKQHRYGKIIQISGGGATTPLPRITAYAASKAAVVRLAESVAMDVREYGIDVNSLAPGVLQTKMLREIIAAGPDVVGEACYNAITQTDCASHTERAAQLAVYLASGVSDGVTGKLIAAQWDPWESLHSRDAILNTDVYTLRRVELPKDA